jgi:hypothetical protein
MERHQHLGELSMTSRGTELERAARFAMGDSSEENDPLPPAPNYGPFGYFRLGILVFALFVAALLAFMVL